MPDQFYIRAVDAETGETTVKGPAARSGTTPAGRRAGVSFSVKSAVRDGMPCRRTSVMRRWHAYTRQRQRTNQSHGWKQATAVHDGPLKRMRICWCIGMNQHT